MEMLGNVATPATADTGVVPESVPPPGFVPIASVMVAVELVTVLPQRVLHRDRRPAGLMPRPRSRWSAAR